MRERTTRPQIENLAGSLLLAHPGLKDPNFRRAVVLMSLHNGDGAMGVVLNRPTGKKLGDLNGDFSLSPLATVPVFAGGPVQTEQMILAAWQAHDEGFKLYFGIEPEKAAQLATEESVHLRAFVGYSGWTGGQLENELKQNTWVIAPVPGDLMNHEQNDELWRAVLGGVSHEWRLLANEPEDPEVN